MKFFSFFAVLGGLVTKLLQSKNELGGGNFMGSDHSLAKVSSRTFTKLQR